MERLQETGLRKGTRVVPGICRKQRSISHQLIVREVRRADRRSRWRAENDKIGNEHVTPISDAAVRILSWALAQSTAIGDSWVLPATRKRGAVCSRKQLNHWFNEAAALAHVDLPSRAGYHSLRRKFATELQDIALRDLSSLGGWKDPKTLLTLYQQPDENAMREGFARRRQFGPSELSVGAFSTDSLAKRMG